LVITASFNASSIVSFFWYVSGRFFTFQSAD